MFCIKCGSQVVDNAKFCQKCGAPIAVVDSVQQTSTEPVSTASQKPVEPTVPPVSKPTEPIPQSPTQTEAMPNPAQESSAEQKTPQTPVTSTADESVPTKDKLSALTKFSRILRVLLLIGAGLLIIVSVLNVSDKGWVWVIPNIVASAFMVLMAVWSGKSFNNVNYNKLGTTVTIIMAGFILTPLRAIFNIFYFHYFDYILIMEDRFFPVLDVFAIVFSLALLIIALKLKPFLPPKRRIKVIGIVGIMGIVILAISLVFTRTKYPDEVLFHGLPITRFLEMTRDDVIKEFGEPRYHTDGSEYYDYPVDILDIRYSNNNGKVVYVRFSSSVGTFNGRVLSRVPLEQTMRLIPSSPIIRTADRIIMGSWSDLSEELERMYLFWGDDIMYFRYLGPRYQDQAYTLDFWIRDSLYEGRRSIRGIFLYTNEWNWVK